MRDEIKIILNIKKNIKLQIINKIRLKIILKNDYKDINMNYILNNKFIILLLYL